MSVSTKTFDHGVGSSLDYSFNWNGGGWLQQGETIIASVWEMSEDLTQSNQQILNGITSVFISGGVDGKVYRVVNTVTSSNNPPRVDSRTLILSCHD